MAVYRNEEGVEIELDEDYANLAERQGFELVVEEPKKKK